MIDEIKKINCFFWILFIIIFVSMAMAQRFEVLAGFPFMSFSTVILLLTFSVTLMVSISEIVGAIGKSGKKVFAAGFIKRWLFCLLLLYVIAFFKNDFATVRLLLSSFANAILSYYFLKAQEV